MLQTFGLNGVVIQAVEQLQRAVDPLVAIILIQRWLPLIDLAHIL